MTLSVLKGDEVAILRRFKRGETQRGIAASYEVTPQAIGAALKRAGRIPRPMKFHDNPLKGNEVKILRRFEDGETITELGSCFDVTRQAISLALQRAGRSPGRRGRPRKLKGEVGSIVQAYRKGKTLTQLAAAYRVSPSTVMSILECADCDRRARGRQRK